MGRVIADRYLIEEVCERTYGSAIYRARHLLVEQTVLLRVLGERTHIAHERCSDALAVAERAGALPSPHVARTLDVGVVADRWPFVVSEYTKGRTLAAIVEREGPFALRRILPIAAALASVLALAHGAGLLHGALPASGIWIESPSGRPEWVRLLDFGVTELLEPRIGSAQSGVYRSTALSDAAPSISPAAIRSDMQALGSLFHELALGSRAASRSSSLAELLDARFAGSVWATERALLRSFARIVERCLTRAPESAYRSMLEVCRDLEALTEATAAIGGTRAEWQPPVTAIHAPARRARVALGGPKVIVRGS
jgi:serine/threonine protein kinase